MISTQLLCIDYSYQSTFFGGFLAEKASGTTGTFFMFLNSRCTRLSTISSKISSFEYLDGSAVPWYWNPRVSWACNGWILRLIQSNTTASPVNIFCLKMAIRPSSSETWFSSTGFLFHSGHWIGGPVVIGGKHPDWFSTKNHLRFHSITLLLRL